MGENIAETSLTIGVRRTETSSVVRLSHHGLSLSGVCASPDVEKEIPMRRFVLTALCLIACALAPTTRTAAGDRQAVPLPEAAFGPEMQAVIWLDLNAVSADSLTAARHALVDAIAPQSAKGANAADAAADDARPDESRQKMDDELKAGAGEFLKFRDLAIGAGAQELVLGVRAPEAKAAAAKAGQSPDDAVVFVRMKDGADPQKLFQAMRMFDAVRKEAGAIAGNGKDAGDGKFDANQYDAKRWSGQWFSVTGPRLAAPLTQPPAGANAAADAGENGPRAITQSFGEALAHEQGAPLRVAFRMNDAARQQVQALLQGPNAMMLRGLAEPLLAMRTASAGLTLGERPSLRLGLHFANAEQAAQFKGTLDRTVTMMSAFASMAALGNKNANGGANAQQSPGIKPELIQAAVAPLMMRQDGADLSTSIDTTFLAKLRELGAGAAGAAAAATPNAAPQPANR
jgi:hypothetical protein